MKNNKWILTVLALFSMYIITVVMLIICASITEKTAISDENLKLAINLIYIVSCFPGGFMIGKIQNEKQCQWGIFAGTFYCFVLLLGNMGVMAVNKEIAMQRSHMLILFILCSISGALGGITSAYNKNKRDM